MPKSLPEWPAPALDRLRIVLRGRVGPEVPEGQQQLFLKLLENLGTGVLLTRKEVGELLVLKRREDPSAEVDQGTLDKAVHNLRERLALVTEVRLTMPKGTHFECEGDPPQEWLYTPIRPLGFLIANAADWFSGQLILGAVEVCRSKGFELIVDVTQDQPEAEDDRLRAMLDRCEGVLMVPVGERLLGETAVKLLKTKHCVLADRYLPGVNVPSVHNDDISGGRKAAEYLLQNGCKRIIIVGQASEENQQQKLTPIADREWGCRYETRRRVPIIWEQPNGLNEEGGFQTLRKIDRISEINENDGIFALTDKVALGCLDYLRSKGFQWPSTNIVSFEGQSLGDYIQPNLPSIHADPTAIGRFAATILIAKLRSEPLPQTNCYPHYLVPPSLLLPSEDGGRRKEYPIEYLDREVRYHGR